MTNAETLQAALEDVWIGGRADRVPVYYRDDFLGHFPPPFAVRGAAELRDTVAELHNAFDGFHEQVHELIPTDDRVVARFTLSGRQQAAFAGFPSNGRRFEVMSVDIYRFDAGLIVEQWGVFDAWGMANQLGWIG